MSDTKLDDGRTVQIAQAEIEAVLPAVNRALGTDLDNLPSTFLPWITVHHIGTRNSLLLFA